MSGWAPDGRFLEDALSQVAQADLVAIDLFDTALTRLLDSPTDLFAEMERRLLERLGPVAAGFALARETAEHRARLAAYALRGAEGIDHDAILDRLPRALSPWREEIRRTELACEADVLVAVPDLLALTRLLFERGVRFAFVSDTYLPAGFLLEHLSACGYRNQDALFVLPRSRLAGNGSWQWAALAAACPGARILHVGDDRQADIDKGCRHGIRTLPYLRARSNRRTALPFTPASLPFSRARRAQALAARADPDVEPGVEPGAEPGEPAFWNDLGRSWGAIVLAGFVRWLETQVARHRIDRLAFCARDGWLIRQAWHASGAPGRTGIADLYLEVARRPLNLAAGCINGSADRLDPVLLGFLSSSDGGVSVRGALRRAGLEGNGAIEADMVGAFGDADTMLVGPGGTGLFEQVLQGHAAAVHAALVPERVALTGYLRQTGMLDGGRVGLVDLGWHANMQRTLRTVLDAEGASTELHGFYYGLWPPAQNNRHAAGAADAAFASDFEPSEQNPGVTDAVEMLEELHTAPHGTVLSYREDATGTWRAVLADDAAERAQYGRAAQPFQSACIETVAELFRTGRSGTLALSDITPDVVRATLAAVSLSPDATELRLLGGLGHHATFDHARYKTLVPHGLPRGAEARDAALRSCGWRLGTALRWVERAGDDAPEVRAWVRHVMSHYGERVLRRLG